MTNDRAMLTERLCELVEAPASKTASWQCSKGANPYWALKVGKKQYRFDWCGNTHPVKDHIQVFEPTGSIPRTALDAMQGAIRFLKGDRR